MSSPSEKAIEAAWDGAQGSPLRSERSHTLSRVYPVIRADVVREVVEWARSSDPAQRGVLAVDIEREFGGEHG